MVARRKEVGNKEASGLNGLILVASSVLEDGMEMWRLTEHTRLSSQCERCHLWVVFGMLASCASVRHFGVLCWHVAGGMTTAAEPQWPNRVRSGTGGIHVVRYVQHSYSCAASVRICTCTYACLIATREWSLVATSGWSLMLPQMSGL